MATDSPENRKGPRPFESALLERGAWHRCQRCGLSFGTSEGLRSHRRFGRCPGQPEPLDVPGLPEGLMRSLVRERLRLLTDGRYSEQLCALCGMVHPPGEACP